MSVLNQFLLGVYLGVLTGIIPGVVAWALGFLFKYSTRVTIPALGVMALAVALAGVQGGLLGLLEVQGITAITALLIVMMISMYCHSQGDQMGTNYPHRVSIRTLRNKTLSSDVIERVGKFGQVRINVVGEVVEMEGYAPVSEETKKRIKEGEWELPADLPVAELENRMAEKLTEEFSLSDVSVSIDSEGSATVIAAPPMGGLSKRVPKAKRAVSFPALVPAGLSSGDEVSVEVDGSTTEGTVVSARSGISEGEKTEDSRDVETATAMDAKRNTASEASSATGGNGRITVAVDRNSATKILEEETGKTVVRSRGTRREYELISVLKSAGKGFRKVDVGSSVKENTTLESLGVRDRFGVIVLAIKRGQKRILAPRGDEPILVGDELFIVGTKSETDEFAEVVK